MWKCNLKEKNPKRKIYKQNFLIWYHWALMSYHYFLSFVIIINFCCIKIITAYRLLAAPVIVEGTERAGSAGAITEGSITAARLELLEVLPEQPGQDTELLCFKGPPAGAPLAHTPNLQLSFTHSEKPTSQRQSTSAQRTRLS
jgi:hypothetical protein